MVIGDAIRIGLTGMVRRPLRSFLVLQGVIWGVALGVFPPAVLNGSRQAAVQRAEELGSDRIVITGERHAGIVPLDLSDLAVVRAICGPDLIAAAPVRVRKVMLARGEERERAWLVGTTPDWPEAAAYRVGKGAFLEPAPGPLSVVIDPGLAAALLAKGEALGQEVFVERKVSRREGERVASGETRVVRGVMETRRQQVLETDMFGIKKDHPMSKLVRELRENAGVAGGESEWLNSERCAFVPIEDLPPQEDDREPSRIATDPIDYVILRARPEAIPRLVKDLRGALIERSRAPLLYANSLWPILASEEVRVYERLNLVVFATCLFMGGVVVTCLMLMSVMERYHEIAIRRVEGATAWDIAVQITVESLVICLVGGVLGLPAGMALAQLRKVVEPNALMSIVFPTGHALVALGLTATVGILAGLLPARRAVQRSPVEILRYE